MFVLSVQCQNNEKSMQNLKHVHSTQDTFLTSKALYEVVPGHQEASDLLLRNS